MRKDATYKEKFEFLKDWMPQVIDSIKKDLKNDHLKNDLSFMKKYFPLQQINKITTEELSKGYLLAIEKDPRSEELGEFIANRWLLKNTELYSYFEEVLSKINPNFSEIEQVGRDQSLDIAHGALNEFGALNAYIFAILNSVVLHIDAFDLLNQRALEMCERDQTSVKEQMEKQSFEALKKNHEQQIARLTDKYEKKLRSLQRKYLQDVDALKKQIALLQRKLGT